MAIREAEVTIKGTSPLLQNNPQTVNQFNPFTKAKKAITAKRTAKTDDDLLELADLEVESKLYFDDKIGVYVPARWLTEAVITSAYAVAKIGRGKMRGGIFPTAEKIPLVYRGQNKVRSVVDLVKNQEFRHFMILPQGQVRVAKYAPIFHDWSFSTLIEFDDSVIDFGTLKRVAEHTAKYVGFGDFRPTFGRAIAEVKNVC